MRNPRIAASLKALKKNKAVVFAHFEMEQQQKRDTRKKWMKDYVKKRRGLDVQFKILGTLRCRLTAALKSSGTGKKYTTTRMLGCSMKDFLEYVGALFTPGMSWENHGEWELDHVKPCRAFNLTCPEEQKRCFHHSNFQPLWKDDNRRKSDKWNGLHARKRSHLA